MTEKLPAQQPKRPTLRSLAKLLGLGVSTVSLALRDSSEISVATRQRVQLAAKQVGYLPNRAGVRLRTGKTNVITVALNPQDEGSGFFADFVFGIADALAGTPYHLLVSPYSLSDPMAPIRYIVETGSADGAILSRTHPDDQRVRYLHQHGFHFATHGRTSMGLQHAFFDYDNEAYAFEALRLLASRGRKRVALLGPPRQLTYHIHTNLGFERGLREFGLSAVPLASADTEEQPTVTWSLGQRLASMQERPDGFVVSGLGSAMALAAGLRDAGLTITQDFDIVSKRSTALQSLVLPGIISIPEDFRRAGRQVANLLVRNIAGEDVSALQQVAMA